MQVTRWFSKEHRWKWVAGIAAVVVVVAAALVAGRDGDSPTERTAGPATSSTSSTTTTASTTTSTTSAPPITAPPTTAPPTTAPPADPPPGPVPGAVPGVEARTGAGSGETEVHWHATAGATGYRVLRSTTPDGPWSVLIEIDVTTGDVDVDLPAGSILAWVGSAHHVYRAGDHDTRHAPDPSDRFMLVEYAGGVGQRCYRVVAVNAAGAGPPSSPVCARAPGG